MKVLTNVTLSNFQAWSGAILTKERILKEGKEDDFNSFIDEIYPDGLTDTSLNDLLWFESEFVYNNLGMEVEY